MSLSPGLVSFRADLEQRNLRGSQRAAPCLDGEGVWHGFAFYSLGTPNGLCKQETKLPG